MDPQDIEALGESVAGATYSREFMRWAGSERLTLAIAITDIVGSTALGVELGDKAMNTVRRAHFDQTRNLISEYSGQEIKITGDGFIAAFRSVPAALDYALAIHAVPGARELEYRVRAAVHIGPVQPDEGDIFGNTVNMALQVIGAVPGNGICLSDAAMQDLSDYRAARYRELQWEERHTDELKFWSLVITREEISQLSEEIQQIEVARSHLIAMAALFAFVFLTIMLRLVEVVALGEAAESHLARNEPIAPKLVRADIIDRNGKLLATMLDSPSLYADPRQILDADDATHALSAVLPQVDPIALHNKLTSGKSFVWIKRHLTPREEFEVNRLGIPGLRFQTEQRRVYPFGDLVAHIIGFCDIDNNGLTGLERALDEKIRASSSPVELSIDARVQAILHKELTRTVSDFAAKGAAGVIIDVHTGEILAMVSLPDFDPSRPGDRSTAEAERVLNKITSGDYEMGSVMMIFYTAMALDSGVATMSTKYDTNHSIHTGRFTIEGYRGRKGWLSLPDIFVYSSNIGFARMAEAAGPILQGEFLSRFGLLSPVPIELGEVTKPHYVRPWGELNAITIGIGYGLSLSPLNVITAASAMVNGGLLRAPTLMKKQRGAEPSSHQVVSEKTSQEIRKLMRSVAQHGAARSEFIPGYLVGGVNGTTEDFPIMKHQKPLLSTSIAAFPMNDPRYMILTMVNNPGNGGRSSERSVQSWSMGPANNTIIQRVARVLDVTPVDEASPEFQLLSIDDFKTKRMKP